ncbi:MAG: nucleotidyltransferase domain-containing protein [Candidatus Edwardsbacteria bacterium]|nr:nucleotidyltransferase domain-containing protein [Candidatus Edwardsbacteria bacterium]
MRHDRIVLDQALIREIVEPLTAEFAPEKIFLFGSYAWGKPSGNSDLDLMLVVPHSDMPPAQRATRAYRCLRGIRMPKDIIVKTRAEFERFVKVPASLEAMVAERGLLLYG